MALTMASLPQPPSWQGVFQTNNSISLLIVSHTPSPDRGYGWVETHGGAGLDVELANRGPVVHGVERGDLVDAHGGHLEDARHLVHDADAGEAVLALAEVEQRHDGGLLVLGRVPLEDLGDDGLILGGELEGDVGVVVGGVAVLSHQFHSISLSPNPIHLEYSSMIAVASTYHHEGVAPCGGRNGKGAGGGLGLRARRCPAYRPNGCPDGGPHDEGCYFARHSCCVCRAMAESSIGGGRLRRAMGFPIMAYPEICSTTSLKLPCASVLWSRGA